MLGLTFLFPVAKPPSFAHAFAAGAVVRNLTKARIAGVSWNATSRSPPTSTPFEAVLIDGNVVTLKPVVGFAFVEERITPATKSPSNTIAAFGGDEYAFVTEALKLFWSAPALPPAMLPVSPMICAMLLSAVFTDASVHLILCAVNAAYFAGPKVRR